MSAPARSLGQRLARHLARLRQVHGTSVPADLQRLRACLKPGDVLLVEGHSRVSTAIKYLTQSTWSHAALYVETLAQPEDAGSGPEDAPCFIEADMLDGVRAVPLSQFAGLHARVCRPASLSAEDAAGLVRHHSFCVPRDFDVSLYFEVNEADAGRRLHSPPAALGRLTLTRLACMHNLPQPVRRAPQRAQKTA